MAERNIDAFAARLGDANTGMNYSRGRNSLIINAETDLQISNSNSTSRQSYEIISISCATGPHTISFSKSLSPYS